MKRWKTLIILTLVVVVLFGSYFILKNEEEQKSKKAAPVAESTAPPEIFISKMPEKQITQMTLKTSDGTLAFQKKANVWSAVGSPSKLDQEQIQLIASTFAELPAEEIIDKAPKDLSAYGLAHPSITAEAMIAGQKTSRTIDIGDATPSSDGFYAMVKGDPKVYRISGSYGSRFRTSINDLRNKELPGLDYQRVTYFKLSRTNGKTIEIRTNPNRSVQDDQYGLNVWQLVQPYPEKLGVNVDKFTKDVIQNLQNMQITEYVADQPKDLNVYGLAQPLYHLIVKDPKSTLELFIGKHLDEGSYYCKLPNDPGVFTISQDNLSFLNITPFDLVSKLAYLVNIDTVDRIVIQANHRTRTLTLTRKLKKKATKGQPAEYAVTYRVEGKPVKEDVFKSFYQDVIGLTLEAEHEKKLTDLKPEIKIIYILNSGAKRQSEVDFLPFNENFYAVSQDGNSHFLISRDQVKQMTDHLELLVHGKLKPTNL